MYIAQLHRTKMQSFLLFIKFPFLLGQYPPHALPPMLHQVQTPPPPRQVERRVTSSPGRHRNQVSPSSAPHRDNTGSEAKQKSDAEPHSYLMKPLVVGGCQEVGM